MKVELSEREISVIQCALWLAKDEYKAYAVTEIATGTLPRLVEQFDMQAKETEALWNKLETIGD